jgi:S1-C subfamily serine protease
VQIEGLLPPDGPAGQAGLQPGDVILQIDRVTIKSKDHLIRAIGARRPGSRAQVTFLRNGSRHTVAVTMAERRVNPVMLGSAEQDRGLRTCHWRGAWLQEPPADMLQMQGLNPDGAGLAVVIVDPGSDADQAGLEPAQMILTLNRKRVRTIEEFLAADQKAGPQVRLQVHTEDGPKTVRMPKQDRSL